MSSPYFIIAKVRGMRGKLYEGEKLTRLCDAPGIEELAATLAPGEPIGDTIGLQRHLTAQHVRALRSILVHLAGWRHELFLWMLRRYQVENLKVLLRAWATHAEPSLLARYTVDLPGAIGLPIQAMMNSPDLESVIRKIPVPELQAGAFTGLGGFEESGRLFFVEAGLDQGYLAELRRRSERVGEESRPAVRQLVGLELDIYNVMLVLRAMFDYSIPFNKVRGLFAPFGAYVGLRVLEQLRHAPDLDAAAGLVPPPALGATTPAPSAEALETAMWQNLYRVANRWYYSCVLDFGAIAAFYYIKRVELRNLIRISEHVRYGERGAAIRDQLIRRAAEPAWRA